MHLDKEKGPLTITFDQSELDGLFGAGSPAEFTGVVDGLTGDFVKQKTSRFPGLLPYHVLHAVWGSEQVGISSPLSPGRQYELGTTLGLAIVPKFKGAESQMLIGDVV